MVVTGNIKVVCYETATTIMRSSEPRIVSYVLNSCSSLCSACANDGFRA